MFSTIWNGIERDRMLEGKKVCFFWQSGRLLANQSDTQAAVNYAVPFFIQAIHQDCGKSVQRMPPGRSYVSEREDQSLGLEIPACLSMSALD